MQIDSTFDPARPFTRAQGLQAGLTPWALRSDRYVRLHRNLYVAAGADPSLVERACAVLMIAPPGATISHFTAARIWGGTVPESSMIWVTVRCRDNFTGVGIRIHHSDRERATTLRFGLRITTPEQTFIDMARYLDLVQLVVLGDRLVRAKVTTVERLRQETSRWEGQFREHAQTAATYVRTGVDSPPETRLRMLIVLSGLPEPTVNYAIRDAETGDIQRRFELAYEEYQLAVEYEGMFHRGDPEVWARDISRREDLDRRDWRIIQVISSGLYDAPHVTLQRIDGARVDRGAKPTAFGTTWRRYFPGSNRPVP